ncbi:MAG: LysR family transcriptional regulator, partial [Candidatus Competibacteraceae bacterium]|nr:LysR family transcriptional regulator [Candidatus Competibacteraceae bacterium]
MHYTLRQLQVFMAVARHENVSRAAQELSLSQSAASAALGDLERQFDLRLFDRSGRRLHLNDLGRALRPRVVELLDRAQELEDLLRRREAPGILWLGASLTIGNYLATLLISD